LRRVFHRVVEQVSHSRRQRVFVAFDERSFASRECDGMTGRPCNARIVVNDVPDHCRTVVRLEAILMSARLHTPKIEHRFNQPRQSFGRASLCIVRRAPRLGAERRVLPEHVGKLP
jgi:hypothetical protein